MSHNQKPTGKEIASGLREFESELLRRKCWLEVFYTQCKNGKGAALSAIYADNALEEYDKRFTLQPAAEDKKENHD